MRRRAPKLTGAAILVAVGLAACGSTDEETPVGCLSDSDAYLGALSAAPGDVFLEGGTPISDCLVPDQDVGAQNAVGSAAIEAATQLNAQARRQPSGDATVQLGYLIGAIQEGATRTGGIHIDLVRRLDAAARFSPGGEPLSAAFERELGVGYAAGQDAG
jgi:hypothetical protein